MIQNRKGEHVTNQQQAREHRSSQQVGRFDPTASLLKLILDEFIRIRITLLRFVGNCCHVLSPELRVPTPPSRTNARLC